MEIKRYESYYDERGDFATIEYYECEVGDWVKYSDVEKLIKDAHANVPTAPTDEEIGRAAPCNPDAGKEDVLAHNWFIAGAKWMRDKLTNK